MNSFAGICNGLNSGVQDLSCSSFRKERNVMAADLLGMNQMALNRVKTTWPQKTLKPFIYKGLSMATTLIKVVTNSSELLSLNN